MHRLSKDLIETLIPAATKATVAGGSGGRRSKLACRKTLEQNI